MTGRGDGGRTVFHAGRLQDLTALAAFLDDACAGLDLETRTDVRLATEEVFVNIFKHGYRGDRGPVDIDVSHVPGRVTVLIVDEAPTFDPASVPTPDLHADCSDRDLGGLGWHLVRHVIDEVGWEAGATRGNAYRLVKHVAADAMDSGQTQRGTRT